MKFKSICFFSISFIISACFYQKQESHINVHSENPPKTAPISQDLEKALLRLVTSQTEKKISAECPTIIEEILFKNSDLATDQIQTECGAIQVPHFHDKIDGLSSSVAYLFLSKNPKNNKKLLVIEQGGPGSSSMILAAHYVNKIPDLIENFNILAIEQRGTDWTRPKLTCDETVDFQLMRMTETSRSERTSKEQLTTIQRKCLDTFSTTHSIDSISTFQIASDIHLATALFGYQKYTFFGVSYGGLVGQYLLAYFPHELERVVLDSTIIPAKHWRHDAYHRMEFVIRQNIQHFIDTESQRNSWNKNYDETLSYFIELAQIFDSSPTEVNFNYRSKDYKVLFTKNDFIGLVYGFAILGKITGLQMLIQSALAKARHEENSILTDILNHILDPEESKTDIMYQALICREFQVSSISFEFFIDQVPSAAKLFNLTKQSGFLDTDTCYLNFSKSGHEKVLRNPVTSSVPTVVVGAELDHVTSPDYASDIAAHLTDGTSVIFQDVGHGVLAEKDCINKSIIDFLKGSHFKNECE